MPRRLSFGFFLLCTGARAGDGLYVDSFDPILQVQIDGALKAAETYHLDRIYLIPSAHSSAGVSLEKRWRLLKAAAAQDSRLAVPALEEISKLKTTRDWKAFYSRHAPRDAIFQPIFDGPKKPDLPFSSKLESPVEIYGVEKKPNFPRGKSVQVLADPDNVRRVRSTPQMNEGLMPKAVAEMVREEKLYGHSGERGYYGLPDWLTKQVDLEQTLNDRIEDVSKFSSINASTLPREYSPEMRPTFVLSHVDVPIEEIEHLKTGDLPAGIVIFSEGKRKARFFIHPSSLNHYKKAFAKYKLEKKYWATPTSSHRSLIVWDPHSDEPPFGVKASLDAEIGGSRRLLSRSQIERASAASALFNSIEASALEKEGIIMMDEPVGFTLRASGDGYALRKLIRPRSRTELIPMFSLYSKPPGGEPPLVVMIKKSRQDPKTFLRDKIMQPLIRQYHYLAWEHGVVGEPHEQNLVMELKDGLPTGIFYYRDMAGFHIKPDLRAALDKGLSFLPAGIRESSLKSDRADVVDNAVTYLRDSNFFALRESLKGAFPEISEAWVDSTFRELTGREIARYSGGESALTIPEWKKAYGDFVRKKSGCPEAWARISQ